MSSVFSENKGSLGLLSLSAHKIKLALGRSYFVFALLVGLISNGRRPRMTSKGRRRGWLPIRRGYA